MAPVTPMYLLKCGLKCLGVVCPGLEWFTGATHMFAVPIWAQSTDMGLNFQPLKLYSGPPQRSLRAQMSETRVDINLKMFLDVVCALYNMLQHYYAQLVTHFGDINAWKIKYRSDGVPHLKWGPKTEMTISYQDEWNIGHLIRPSDETRARRR